MVERLVDIERQGPSLLHTFSDHEKIRARAHRIWEAEGCPDGKHLDPPAPSRA
jgi:hypothetical protein